MAGRAAVFLDRDGTLNEEVNYLRTPDALHMVEGAAESVRMLNQAGYITCVISNQSGIARGFLSEADLLPIHTKLKDELRRAGAFVDGIYYCPHHPTEGKPPYNIVCECRKPKPGMLLQAAREFNIDLQRSFVIGDSVVDTQAGNAVGAKTILVQTGYGVASVQTCKEQNIPVHSVVRSIVEAVEFILHNHKEKELRNE